MPQKKKSVITRERTSFSIDPEVKQNLEYLARDKYPDRKQPLSMYVNEILTDHCYSLSHKLTRMEMARKKSASSKKNGRPII